MIATLWNFLEYIKMTFKTFGDFLHKWKDNGEKIHRLKFEVTWEIRFKLIRPYSLI